MHQTYRLDASHRNHYRHDIPGLQKIAPEILEKRDIETQLRDAQYSLDLLLHDLRAEFLSRESKLRQDYLDKVAEITS
jgi:hypothetical protein